MVILPYLYKLQTAEDHHSRYFRLFNMLLLVIVGLVGSVAAEPQAVLPVGYNIMSLHNGQSIMPYAYSPIPGSYIPSSGIIPASPGIIPTSSGIIPMGHNIIYPSLDITMARSSSGAPKPVEDTPEVKKARMDFELAYSKALAGTPETSQVFRARRDVNRVLPYGYTLPYTGYMTPYSQVAHQIPTSSIVPSNVYQSPYVSHY